MSFFLFSFFGLLGFDSGVDCVVRVKKGFYGFEVGWLACFLFVFAVLGFGFRVFIGFSVLILLVWGFMLLFRF